MDKKGKCSGVNRALVMSQQAVMVVPFLKGESLRRLLPLPWLGSRKEVSACSGQHSLDRTELRYPGSSVEFPRQRGLQREALVNKKNLEWLPVPLWRLSLVGRIPGRPGCSPRPLGAAGTCPVLRGPAPPPEGGGWRLPAVSASPRATAVCAPSTPELYSVAGCVCSCPAAPFPGQSCNCTKKLVHGRDFLSAEGNGPAARWPRRNAGR